MSLLRDGLKREKILNMRKIAVVFFLSLGLGACAGPEGQLMQDTAKWQSDFKSHSEGIMNCVNTYPKDRDARMACVNRVGPVPNAPNPSSYYKSNWNDSVYCSTSKRKDFGGKYYYSTYCR